MINEIYNVFEQVFTVIFFPVDVLLDLRLSSLTYRIYMTPKNAGPNQTEHRTTATMSIK